MSRILITSGPTREYLDPIRYLTNGSSGKMGAALAAEAIRRGHEVVVISGPVAIGYPPAARIIPVVSTRQMLTACLAEFPTCGGVIGAAAPCDIAPKFALERKQAKAELAASLEWVETPDVIAELGKRKSSNQWSVAFALETHDGYRRALEKMRQKNCDLIVLNDASAMEASQVQVHIISPDGESTATQGSKSDVAARIFDKLAAVLVSGLRT